MCPPWKTWVLQQTWNHCGAEEGSLKCQSRGTLQSSPMVEVLLSGAYWKVVHSFVVTDTDCDSPHTGTQAWGSNIEHNKEYKVNGESCHLPISHLTTYFTLDCISQHCSARGSRHMWIFILALRLDFLRHVAFNK